MADDAEWHTVPNHKQPTNCPKSQKQSKPKIQTKEKKLTPQPMKEKVENPKQANEKKPEIKEKKVKENKSGEKTCSLENKSTGDSKKPEKKSTGASRHFREKRLAKKKKKPTSEEDSDTEEEEGTSPKPLPPYHTTTFVSCPFKDCETPAPFLDTTSLVNHLKEHHLVFKNLHHMYNSLDAYLKRWAKEFEQKPLEEFGKKEQDVYIIDPEKCNLDKEIREQLQRTTLNEVLKLQQHEREVEAKCSKKCLFCKIVGENR
ncbi:hypothetical protein G6F56_009479 [Rhizopus delemar]|nr:hypothetical protein G6F56_009479 [Rhizopus delemar]